MTTTIRQPTTARACASSDPSRLIRHLGLAGCLWLAACGGGGGGGEAAVEEPDLAQIQTPATLLAKLPRASSQPLLWSRKVVLPATPDDGRALGTLFSILDAQGLPFAAAGFLHGMQSGVSLPRRQLSFFIGHNDDPASSFQALPPGDAGPFASDTLFTLTVYRDTLLAFRYKKPGRVRAFQPETRTWVDFDDPALPYDDVYPVRNLQTVGNQLLVTYDNRVLWAGRPLRFNAPALAGEPSFYISAYNDGALRLGYVRRTGSGDDAVLTAGLAECRWTPPGRDVNDCQAVEMPPGGAASMNHLLYGLHALPQGPVVAFGLDGDLLNWASGQWQLLRTPQPGESWQVYATTEVDDRVLMGHYPSGGVLSMATDGAAGVQVAMVTPSVSNEPDVRRDEVQSLVPFGGEVMAGVWPWGEIYRGHPQRGWAPFIQTFSRAGGQPDAGHPFDDLGVANCLGQRVFQILPWQRGFVYSTTMKNNDAECAGALDRLAPEARAEYGRVVVVERSHALSCGVVWTDQPSTLTFGVTADQRMVVLQEGRELCSTPLTSPDLLQRLLALDSGSPNTTQKVSSGLFGPVRR